MKTVKPDQTMGKHATKLSAEIYGIYLVFALILPGFLLFSFKYWPTYYNYIEVDAMRFLLIVMLLLIPFGFDRIIPVPASRIRTPLNPAFTNGALIVMIAIATASVASGNSRWRYSEAPISEMGGIWLFFFMIMPALGKLLVLNILYLRQTAAPPPLTKILLFLMLVLTINGNMTAIFAIAVGVLMLSNRHSLIFQSNTRTGLITRIFSYSAIIFVSAAGLTIAYVYGESVKRGSESTDVYLWISDSFITQVDWLKNLILGRMSPTLISTLHIAQNNWCQTLACQNFDFFSIVRTGLFRISSMFDFYEMANIAKDIDGTVSRVNYNEISINPANLREGTSPGLLPGFFYAFGGYLSIPFYIIYTFTMIAVTKRVVSLIGGKLSLIGKLLLAYLILPMYESPLDMFMILDDSFIYRAGLIILCWWRVRELAPRDPKQAFAFQVRPASNTTRPSVL